MENLLNEIVNCKCIGRVLNNDLESPCRSVINAQGVGFDSIQLPEPWCGNIEKSKVLYVSSNPSINPHEQFPDSTWSQEDVGDFFINRFDNEKLWVRNELYPLLKDGSYAKNWIRFWGALRSMSRILLETHNPIPGIDYAMTEIVHCKSIAELGVDEAMDTCANKYLERIINKAKANLILCLGDKTKSFFVQQYHLDFETRFCFIPALNKTVVFVPHPNARCERKLDILFTPDELNEIKSKI